MSTVNSGLPVLANDDGLRRYLMEIRKFPVLTPEEEHELAIRWHYNGDTEAAQILVQSHLRLAAKTALQFKGYGLPITDIISEGNIGLMMAVKKFDPNMGYRLATYAVWWIKASIQSFILKSWSIVKFGSSAAHKKLFFNLRKIRSKILQESGGVIPYNETALIAKELDVSEQDVRDMSAQMSSQDDSLNATVYGDESGGTEMIEFIEEPSENQESIVLNSQEDKYKRAKFKSAFATLNEREKEIIAARRLKEKPIRLEILADRFGVSSERIRQIEKSAMNKMTNFIASEVTHVENK